jgi:hypothetical protein
LESRKENFVWSWEDRLALEVRDEPEIAMMRWSRIPFWAKDLSVGLRTINAKAETITTTPALHNEMYLGRRRYGDRYRVKVWATANLFHR